MKAIVIAAICILVLLTGCSHNPALFALGDHDQISFGPPDTAASWTSTSGVLIADMPRENSNFTVKFDKDKGVKYDEATGTVTGIIEISRRTGPQVTGYLVKLAKENPELAKIYLQSIMGAEGAE